MPRVSGVGQSGPPIPSAARPSWWSSVSKKATDLVSGFRGVVTSTKKQAGSFLGFGKQSDASDSANNAVPKFVPDNTPTHHLQASIQAANEPGQTVSGNRVASALQLGLAALGGKRQLSAPLIAGEGGSDSLDLVVGSDRSVSNSSSHVPPLLPSPVAVLGVDSGESLLPDSDFSDQEQLPSLGERDASRREMNAVTTDAPVPFGCILRDEDKKPGFSNSDRAGILNSVFSGLLDISVSDRGRTIAWYADLENPPDWLTKLESIYSLDYSVTISRLIEELNRNFFCEESDGVSEETCYHSNVEDCDSADSTSSKLASTAARSTAPNTMPVTDSVTTGGTTYAKTSIKSLCDLPLGPETDETKRLEYIGLVYEYIEIEYQVQLELELKREYLAEGLEIGGSIDNVLKQLYVFDDRYYDLTVEDMYFMLLEHYDFQFIDSTMIAEPKEDVPVACPTTTGVGTTRGASSRAVSTVAESTEGVIVAKGYGDYYSYQDVLDNRGHYDYFYNGRHDVTPGDDPYKHYYYVHAYHYFVASSSAPTQTDAATEAPPLPTATLGESTREMSSRAASTAAESTEGVIVAKGYGDYYSYQDVLDNRGHYDYFYNGRHDVTPGDNPYRDYYHYFVVSSSAPAQTDAVTEAPPLPTATLGESTRRESTSDSGAATTTGDAIPSGCVLSNKDIFEQEGLGEEERETIMNTIFEQIIKTPESDRDRTIGWYAALGDDKPNWLNELEHIYVVDYDVTVSRLIKELKDNFNCTEVDGVTEETCNAVNAEECGEEGGTSLGTTDALIASECILLDSNRAKDIDLNEEDRGAIVYFVYYELTKLPESEGNNTLASYVSIEGIPDWLNALESLYNLDYTVTVASLIKELKTNFNCDKPDSVAEETCANSNMGDCGSGNSTTISVSSPRRSTDALSTARRSSSATTMSVTDRSMSVNATKMLSSNITSICDLPLGSVRNETDRLVILGWAFTEIDAVYTVELDDGDESELLVDAVEPDGILEAQLSELYKFDAWYYNLTVAGFYGLLSEAYRFTYEPDIRSYVAEVREDGPLNCPTTPTPTPTPGSTSRLAESTSTREWDLCDLSFVETNVYLRDRSLGKLYMELYQDINSGKGDDLIKDSFFSGDGPDDFTDIGALLNLLFGISTVEALDAIFPDVTLNDLYDLLLEYYDFEGDDSGEYWPSLKYEGVECVFPTTAVVRTTVTGTAMPLGQVGCYIRYEDNVVNIARTARKEKLRTVFVAVSELLEDKSNSYLTVRSFFEMDTMPEWAETLESLYEINETYNYLDLTLLELQAVLEIGFECTADGCNKARNQGECIDGSTSALSTAGISTVRTTRRTSSSSPELTTGYVDYYYSYQDVLDNRGHYDYFYNGRHDVTPGDDPYKHYYYAHAYHYFVASSSSPAQTDAVTEAPPLPTATLGESTREMSSKAASTAAESTEGVIVAKGYGDYYSYQDVLDNRGHYDYFYNGRHDVTPGDNPYRDYYHYFVASSSSPAQKGATTEVSPLPTTPLGESTRRESTSDSGAATTTGDAIPSGCVLSNKDIFEQEGLGEEERETFMNSIFEQIIKTPESDRDRTIGWYSALGDDKPNWLNELEHIYIVDYDVTVSRLIKELKDNFNCTEVDGVTEETCNAVNAEECGEEGGTSLGTTSSNRRTGGLTTEAQTTVGRSTAARTMAVTDRATTGNGYADYYYSYQDVLNNRGHYDYFYNGRHDVTPGDNPYRDYYHYFVASSSSPAQTDAATEAPPLPTATLGESTRGTSSGGMSSTPRATAGMTTGDGYADYYYSYQDVLNNRGHYDYFYNGRHDVTPGDDPYREYYYYGQAYYYFVGSSEAPTTATGARSVETGFTSSSVQTADVTTDSLVDTTQQAIRDVLTTLQEATSALVAFTPTASVSPESTKGVALSTAIEATTAILGNLSTDLQRLEDTTAGSVGTTSESSVQSTTAKYMEVLTTAAVSMKDIASTLRESGQNQTKLSTQLAVTSFVLSTVATELSKESESFITTDPRVVLTTLFSKLADSVKTTVGVTTVAASTVETQVTSKDLVNTHQQQLTTAMQAFQSGDQGAVEAALTSMAEAVHRDSTGESSGLETTVSPAVTTGSEFQHTTASTDHSFTVVTKDASGRETTVRLTLERSTTFGEQTAKLDVHTTAAVEKGTTAKLRYSAGTVELSSTDFEPVTADEDEAIRSRTVGTPPAITTAELQRTTKQFVSSYQQQLTTAMQALSTGDHAAVQAAMTVLSESEHRDVTGETSELDTTIFPPGTTAATPYTTASAIESSFSVVTKDATGRSTTVRLTLGESTESGEPTATLDVETTASPVRRTTGDVIDRTTANLVLSSGSVVVSSEAERARTAAEDEEEETVDPTTVAATTVAATTVAAQRTTKQFVTTYQGPLTTVMEALQTGDESGVQAAMTLISEAAHRDVTGESSELVTTMAPAGTSGFAIHTTPGAIGTTFSVVTKDVRGRETTVRLTLGESTESDEPTARLDIETTAAAVTGTTASPVRRTTGDVIDRTTANLVLSSGSVVVSSEAERARTAAEDEEEETVDPTTVAATTVAAQLTTKQFVTTYQEPLTTAMEALQTGDESGVQAAMTLISEAAHRDVTGESSELVTTMAPVGTSGFAIHTTPGAIGTTFSVVTKDVRGRETTVRLTLGESTESDEPTARLDIETTAAAVTGTTASPVRRTTGDVIDRTTANLVLSSGSVVVSSEAERARTAAEDEEEEAVDPTTVAATTVAAQLTTQQFVTTYQEPLTTAMEALQTGDESGVQAAMTLISEAAHRDVTGESSELVTTMAPVGTSGFAIHTTPGAIGTTFSVVTKDVRGRETTVRLTLGESTESDEPTATLDIETTAAAVTGTTASPVRRTTGDVIDRTTANLVLSSGSVVVSSEAERARTTAEDEEEETVDPTTVAATTAAVRQTTKQFVTTHQRHLTTALQALHTGDHSTLKDSLTSLSEAAHRNSTGEDSELETTILPVGTTGAPIHTTASALGSSFSVVTKDATGRETTVRLTLGESTDSGEPTATLEVGTTAAPVKATTASSKRESTVAIQELTTANLVLSSGSVLVSSAKSTTFTPSKRTSPQPPLRDDLVASTLTGDSGVEGRVTTDAARASLLRSSTPITDVAETAFSKTTGDSIQSTAQFLDLSTARLDDVLDRLTTKRAGTTMASTTGSVLDKRTMVVTEAIAVTSALFSELRDEIRSTQDSKELTSVLTTVRDRLSTVLETMDDEGLSDTSVAEGIQSTMSAVSEALTSLDTTKSSGQLSHLVTTASQTLAWTTMEQQLGTALTELSQAVTSLLDEGSRAGSTVASSTNRLRGSIAVTEAWSSSQGRTVGPTTGQSKTTVVDSESSTPEATSTTISIPFIHVDHCVNFEFFGTEVIDAVTGDLIRSTCSQLDEMDFDLGSCPSCISVSAEATGYCFKAVVDGRDIEVTVDSSGESHCTIDGEILDVSQSVGTEEEGWDSAKTGAVAAAAVIAVLAAIIVAIIVVRKRSKGRRRISPIALKKAQSRGTATTSKAATASKAGDSSKRRGITDSRAGRRRRRVGAVSKQPKQRTERSSTPSATGTVPAHRQRAKLRQRQPVTMAAMSALSRFGPQRMQSVERVTMRPLGLPSELGDVDSAVVQNGSKATVSLRQVLPVTIGTRVPRRRLAAERSSVDQEGDNLGVAVSTVHLGPSHRGAHSRKVLPANVGHPVVEASDSDDVASDSDTSSLRDQDESGRYVSKVRVGPGQRLPALGSKTSPQSVVHSLQRSWTESQERVALDRLEQTLWKGDSKSDDSVFFGRVLPAMMDYCFAKDATIGSHKTLDLLLSRFEERIKAGVVKCLNDASLSLTAEQLLSVLVAGSKCVDDDAKSNFYEGIMTQRGDAVRDAVRSVFLESGEESFDAALLFMRQAKRYVQSIPQGEWIRLEGACSSAIVSLSHISGAWDLDLMALVAEFFGARKQGGNFVKRYSPAITQYLLQYKELGKGAATKWRQRVRAEQLRRRQLAVSI